MDLGGAETVRGSVWWRVTAIGTAVTRRWQVVQ
jgi:hypothetical protein